MIVRCKQCNAAFAVDDSRVENRKFSFACPRCSFENIIDNRTVPEEKKPEPVSEMEDNFDLFDGLAGGQGFNEAGNETSGDSGDDMFAGLEEFDAVTDVASGNETSGDSGDDIFAGLEEFDAVTDVASGNETSGDSGDDIFAGLEGLADSLSPEIQDAESGPAVPADDESITIDLDALDIDLDSSGSSDLSAVNGAEENVFAAVSPEDDESITLDLDSLNIQVEESDTMSRGLVPETDEKFTLGDAGLTLDDLVDDDPRHVTDTPEELDESFFADDLGLSGYAACDETDFSEEDTDLEKEFMEAEAALNDTDVPDVSDGDYSLFDSETPDPDEEMNDFDMEGIVPDFNQTDDFFYDEEDRTGDPGSVSYSADYSLKYSRILALLRLCFVFLAGMIPHLLAGIIWLAVSLIISLFNNLMIIFSGSPEKDFCDFKANSLRHWFCILGCLTGVADECPDFAGRKNVLYAQQLDVVYPEKFSRILAALRLSVAGILTAALPHILTAAVLACIAAAAWLMGTLAVIFTGRLPHRIFDFLTRFLAYCGRTAGYIAGLTDRYPSFRL